MAPPARNAQDLMQTLAVRRYLLISILALFLLLVVLLDKNMGEWSLLPIALGSITLLLKVRFGPPLVLLTVIVMLLREGKSDDPIRTILVAVSGRLSFPPPNPASSLSDVLLALSVLIYCVAFYRIQSIVSHIFPLDPRRKRLAKGPKSKRNYYERRSPDSISTWEGILLPFVAFIWALIGLALWRWTARQNPIFGFNEISWQFLFLFWLLAVGLMAATAWLAYLDSALAGPEAARVALQDQLWQQTRGEQTHINRWLTKIRLRRQRRKENS